MSFSWVDPHFATLFAQREERCLSDRLTGRLRERESYAEYFGPVPCREPTWYEHELELRGRLRLL